MNQAREIYKSLNLLLTYEPQLALNEAWARIFNIKSNASEYYILIATMMSKFESLKGQLHASCKDEVEARLYIGAIDRLKSMVFPPNFHAVQVTSLTASQSDMDLVYLSGRVLEDYDIPEINPLTLKQLTEEVQELLASLDRCEPPLTPRLLQILESNLRTALYALLSYEVLGLDGFNKVFGSVILNTLRLDADPEMEKQSHRTIIKRISRICKKITIAVSLAHTAVSGAAGMIEDGSKIVGLFHDDGSQHSDQSDVTAIPNADEADESTIV